MSRATRVFALTVLLLCLGGLGLAVGAMIHRQWTGIGWLALGELPLLVPIAGLRSAMAWYERRSATKPPDETHRVRVDQLRNRTTGASTRLTQRPPGKEGWFTADGWYLERGGLLEWSRFQSCGLSRSKTGDYLLHLTGIHPPEQRRTIFWGLIVLTFAFTFGPLIQWYGVVRLLPRLGWRDDVLALIAYAALSTFCYASLLHYFRKAGKCMYRISQTAWVPARVTEREELEGLLRQHLIVD